MSSDGDAAALIGSFPAGMPRSVEVPDRDIELFTISRKLSGNPCGRPARRRAAAWQGV